MRYIKRFFIVLLLLIMCVSLTACEDKNSNKTDTESTLDYLNNRKTNQNSSNGESGEVKETGNFMLDVKNMTSEQALEKAAKQMEMPKTGEQIAIFHVKDFGDIKVKFFENVAPKAVENFVTHAKEGYYNGVTFHRVMNEFMIQGGDPLGNGRGGESIWGKGFDEELSTDVLPYRGALCMASSGFGTSSLGSQFYIVQAHYNSSREAYMQYYGLTNLIEAWKTYGGDLANLVGYGQYTTFGQVFEGMDVVDAIAQVETNSSDKPLSDVIIESIEITTY